MNASRGIYFSFILFFAFSIHSKGDVVYKWKPIRAEFDSIASLFEATSFFDEKRNSLNVQLDEMYQIAKRANDNALMARALYWGAWTQMTHNIDSASTLINKAFDLVDKNNYEYDYIRLLSTKGDILRKSGNWLEAYHIYKNQENYFKKEEDWFYLAKTYVVLGVLFNELKEFTVALDYFESGQEYFQKVNAGNCLIKNKINLSNVLYQLGNIEETIDILTDLQIEPVVLQDTSYLINVMISYFTVSNDAEKEYREQAYKLALKSGNTSLITKTQIGMGSYFLAHNENDSALYYYKQARQHVNQYTDTYDNFSTLKSLSKIYNRLNNKDSAYYYLQEYESVSEQILAQEKIMELNKLESRSKIERYESELRENEEKIYQQKKINRIIISSAIGLFLLISYIFRLLRKKNKITRQLKETENENLLIQNKQLQFELDSKNRELTSNLLNISENNKGLTLLLNKVQTFIGEKSIPEKQGEELKKQIKDRLSADDEWKYFKLHFEKVHPNFFTRLKNNYPKLSKNDLRLCAYIRIGMSNKEIAQIMSVLPETIITTRYRLRKKLNLDHEESLEDLLQS